MGADWTEDLDLDTVRRGDTPRADRQGWYAAVKAAGDLNEAARLLSREIVGGVQDRLETLNGADVIALCALLEDVRRALATTVAYAVREVGRDEAVPETGTLPDGRPYSVMKGKTRKAWDHDLWKRDARTQVLSGVSETLVDPATGETVQVSELLAAVQEVHGSGPPRVAQLRALGLSPDDYAESVPGPWGLKITTTTEG